MTDGNVEVEVSGRNFNNHQLGRFFQKTYQVKNGLINVDIKRLSPYAKTLSFKVTVYLFFR